MKAPVQFDIGVMLEGLAERHQHPLEQPAVFGKRVGEEPDRHPVIQMAQQLAHQHGLAAADITADDREAGLLQRGPKTSSHVEHKLFFVESKV